MPTPIHIHRDEVLTWIVADWRRVRSWTTHTGHDLEAWEELLAQVSDASGAGVAVIWPTLFTGVYSVAVVVDTALDVGSEPRAKTTGTIEVTDGRLYAGPLKPGVSEHEGVDLANGRYQVSVFENAEVIDSHAFSESIDAPGGLDECDYVVVVRPCDASGPRGSLPTTR